MDIDIKTVQIDILERFFKDLAWEDKRKVSISAFKKAAKPLMARAKLLAPKKTGNLRDSIGMMMVPGQIAILVGARKGGYGGNHGHLIENGTMERVRKSGGSTGAGRANNFFERAYEQTYHETYDSVADIWYAALEKKRAKTQKELNAAK